MADDDIDRLLSEVAQATGNQSNTPAKKPGAEVAATSDESQPPSGLRSMLYSGGGGAIVGSVAYLIPLVGWFGLLRTIAAGFLGGVTGYGVSRWTSRKR